MPTSLRRKLFRMQLSVNRKLTATRWIGNTTVGVVRFVGYESLHEKASEGAEKSSRKRKRRRGQRRGRIRSRGRHPRSNHPSPAPADKEPSVRKIDLHLRACDHWYERQEQLCKLFLSSNLYRDCLPSKRLDVGKHVLTYRSWRLRWQKLRQRIVKCGEGVVWCSRIGPTFSYWLEQRFGIIVVSMDSAGRQRAYMKASNTLSSMEESIRIRNDNYTRRPTSKRRLGLSYAPRKKTVPDHEPQQLMRGKKAVCSHCGKSAFSWRNHTCLQAWERANRIGKHAKNLR
jgi:hypothetical protein